MKAIVWIGSSKKDLQHVFSGSARKEAGYQIDWLQMGVARKTGSLCPESVPVFGRYGIMHKMTIGSFTLPGSGRRSSSSMRSQKNAQKTPKLDLARERFELVVKGRGS